MTYGGLPFSGGLLEQPYALMVIVGTLREFATSWAMVERDEKSAPAAAKQLVLRVAAMSATSG